MPTTAIWLQRHKKSTLQPGVKICVHDPVSSGGSDMAGADREDLEQLEKAVRGRLLEVQILKLSAQRRLAQSQFEAYLDIASTAVKPKVYR